MYHWLPFWPNTAAVNAVSVNNLYIAQLSLSAVIMLTVVGMMLTFCIRYRRASSASRANLTETTWRFEIAWTTATLGAFLILFVWGAAIYIWLYQAPAGDEEIYVVAKRWMWKTEHPGGQSEIDALHVPVDKTIRLAMASEDVIHSFFVPAFRIKRDVQARHVFSSVHSVLRASARDNAGQGHRHVGARLRTLVDGTGRARVAGPTGRGAVPRSRLQRMP
jgi:cytochrome c oxidase subunit II